MNAVEWLKYYNFGYHYPNSVAKFDKQILALALTQLIYNPYYIIESLYYKNA